MPTLPVTLDRADPQPLGAQLADQVRRLVLDGVLDRGDRMPASRRLATDLGVSRSVVEQAFDQLLAEGWLEARQGAGTWVAGGPSGGGVARPSRRRAPVPSRPLVMM